MNLKTTFFLILLTGGAVGGWYYLQYHKPVEAAASPTAEFLDNMPSAKLTRIEVTRVTNASVDPPIAAARTIGLLADPFGPLLVRQTLHPRGPQTQFVLEKAGDEWNLPGNWPVRPVETNQWLALLTTLKSRFAPVPLDANTSLTRFGLDDAPLTIIVAAGKDTHTLRFGEEPGDANRFTRSTFVRLDDQKEVLHLGPGVYGALNRSLDYFRQRRLFPIEHVAKDEDSIEKVDRLKANEVEVATETAKFTLEKKDKLWLIKDAYKKNDKEWTKTFSRDRADPGRSDAFVRAFADLWAEKFVELKSPEECGLKEPAYTVTVTRPGGKTELLIGKVSRTLTRFQIKKGPMPIPMETKEEFRFAKLKGNDQIFEIKTDKLDDITLTPETLRDATLARFKIADVKRVEIRHGEQKLVFLKVKDDKDADGKKEKWRMEKPQPDDADAKAIDDFLDKLSDQQARDSAVLDKADLKEVGLDKPAGNIKITIEEGKDDKKKTRAIAFALGVKEKEKDKVYVKVDDWPRVNELNGELWTLAQRSELAYRPRELWKLDADAITRITIEADGKPYNLERSAGAWKITGPLEAEASGREPDSLADDLAHLRVERFEAKKPADLAKYGLDKPAFKITVIAKDKKSHTIEIGKREDSKDGGRYARMAGGDVVFVLNEKLAANFKADASDWLDKGLANINPEEIEKIQYAGATPFTLEKKKGEWQVINASSAPLNVEKGLMGLILSPWQKLRAEKIVDTGKKIDLAKYGLDKPAATITVTTAAGDKTKDVVVELGSDAKDGGRYARFDKKDTVVVLNTFLADQLNRSYLDFVDPRMIRPFDLDAVSTIERKMPGGDFELARRDDSWNLVKPSLREADNLTVFDLLQRTSGLTAKRIEAVSSKDLAKYGLDKPAAVVTFILDEGGKRHVIKVGKQTENKSKGEKDERYALVDDKQLVIVLSAELSRHLVASPLYFADRNLASFSNVDRAELTRGSRKLAFTREGAWQITAPLKADADGKALDEMIRSLQRLRADEIVADKGADLKKYGLDKPAAEWRLKSGSEDQLHLLVGGVENDTDGRRYAKLGNRNAVFLLNARTSARLLAEYRVKNVWPVFDADKIEEFKVTGPDGQFTLKKKDKDWTVVGKTGAKVKANMVEQSLNILEMLKAHHYVADVKSDLKQFGLEKPAWKLEVPTPSGKRELWIGAMEDKSKRPYATVAGNGAVFVLDEIDNVILARPLSSYVEEKKN